MGKVTSSLWGESPHPWRIQVKSTQPQDIPSPVIDGISGWIVKIHRYIRDLSSPTYGTIESGEDSNAPWKLEYQHRYLSTLRPIVREQHQPNID